MICPSIEAPKFFLFTSQTSNLVYYSHLTSFFIAVLIIFLISFSKDKSASKKYLLWLISAFIFWIICSLVAWTNNYSNIIIFFWSFFGLLTCLMSIFSYWLFRSFVFNENISLKHLIWSSLILIPVVFITPTALNLKEFDINVCGIPNEGKFPYYYSAIAFVFIILIIVEFIIALRKKYFLEKKSELFFSLGIVFFMLSFFTTSFLASYLVQNGIIIDFGLEQYGLFGMTAFLAVLTYTIVKYKTFNIKLLGSQALVWSLVILVGSQFLFLDNMPITSIVLTSVTLVLSSWIGLLVVRSVKKEAALVEQLEISNEGQKNLIHIMNHQIKGYLGKNKDIFAELLTDDYGKIPDSATPILKTGLEETNEGVEFVTQILRGASAENGTLLFDMKNTNLINLLTKAFEAEKKEAEKKGLKISLDIDRGDYGIWGDEKQLTEALKNLIDNSIYYTPSGSIEIKLSKNSAGKALMTFKDTGVGVRTEDMSRLFKPGGVAKDSIKVNIKSSGYGLVFVKGVVESHKGKIWLESEGEGKGSTFFVELPITKNNQ